MTVTKVKSWNNLKSDTIFPGQSLRVEGSNTPLPKPEPAPAKAPQAAPSNKIEKGMWVRVPDNKLYATGDAISPVKSSAMSAQVDTFNSNWRKKIHSLD